MDLLRRLFRSHSDWIPATDPNPSYEDVISAARERVRLEDVEGGTSTLFACDNEEQRQAIQVPLQRHATTSKRALTSEVASISCASLNVQGLLEKLNSVFDTQRPLGSDPSLEALLQLCINRSFDFGVACSLLGPRWQMSAADALADIALCQVADERLRKEALGGTHDDVVLNISIPPRRVWDLWTNRVVDIWMTAPYDHQHQRVPPPPLFAVSHSWMDDALRANIEADINGRAWPIPLPVDTTLERIRMELLNSVRPYDTHFAWLDVLCLRQKDTEEKEELRFEEWKLDVPTIGATYQLAMRVVYYFSGLGRAFQVGDLQSPRHWVNRAWTLQETLDDQRGIIAGITPSSPSLPVRCDDTKWLADAPEDVQELWRILQRLSGIWKSGGGYVALSAMRPRSASGDIDKVAGLAYRLADPSRGVPSYMINGTPEQAWERTIPFIKQGFREDLLYRFPERGNGRYSWCPSWQQVQESPLPRLDKPPVMFRLSASPPELCRFFGFRIDNCTVEGLGEGPDGGVVGEPREGKITVQAGWRRKRSYRVAADHGQPIADGNYSLIGEIALRYWAVAKCIDSAVPSFEKISVLELLDVEKKWYTSPPHGFTKDARSVFV